jgi:hypothetical protein
VAEVKIRLWGTEDECRELAGRLPAITDVLSVSEPRADRGASRLVRVYVECRPYPANTPRTTTWDPAAAPSQDQRASDLAQRMTSGRRRRALPPGGAR